MRPTGQVVFSLLLLTCSICLSPSTVSADPRITATAALIMDADSGAILHEKNAHLPLPMASTTKIMTGLLGFELLSPDTLVRVSPYAASMAPSKVYLKSGELISAEELLHAILLASANDASVALAEKISGSEEVFARVMTRRAQELGARNTHFENASGLPAEGHYSTAYDLAILLRYAMQRPDFAEIIQLKTARIVSRAARVRNVRNHNRLLWTFPGAIGGKTGFTRAARRCYVGMAGREGHTLIVSILGSSDLWGDARRLFEHGFDEAGAGAPQLVLSSQMTLLPSPSAARRERKPMEVSGDYTLAYTVQVGAFRLKTHAIELRDKLRRRGYEAHVTSAGPRGSRWYRVRVGEYGTRGEARGVVGRLQNQMGLQAHVATAN